MSLHVVLDINVVLDLLLKRGNTFNEKAALYTALKSRGVTTCFVASALPALEFVHAREVRRLCEQGMIGSPISPSALARRQLDRFLSDCLIVTSLGSDWGNIPPDHPDREDAMISMAAASLPGKTFIWTEDRQFKPVISSAKSGDHGTLIRFLNEEDRKPVPFIDLEAQQLRIRPDVEGKIFNVLRNGQYIMGPEIRELEEKLAAYVGVKHAVGCASGTDALLMALMAYGIGPGDAIFTTPFTFVATAEVISLLGATPVFVDIDPVTFNIDPVKLEQAILALKMGDPSRHPLPVAIVSAAAAADGAGMAVAPSSSSETFTLRPRGIIAVDLFGLPADYDIINAIARKYDLFVIEDGAQSFGAEYQGRKSCSLADIACTSFFPAKPLGGYGDGGMLFTDNDELITVLRSIRVHGQGSDKYENVRIGINGRLDTLQAAILLAKFAIFPEEVELRQTVAERYRTLLTADASRPGSENAPCPHSGLDKPDPAGCKPGESSYGLKVLDSGLRRNDERDTEMEFSKGFALAVIPPTAPPGYKSVWAQYSILAKDEADRARLQEALKSAGIPTAIYYPLPLHLQGAFASLGYKSGDFPVTEEMACRIFSVPMHPYLDRGEQELICRHLKAKHS